MALRTFAAPRHACGYRRRAGSSAASRPARPCQQRARPAASAAVAAPEPAAEDEPTLAGGLSEDEAVANIAKAVMGAGVFSLPWATARGGLLFVPAFIAAAAALSLYTLSVLVNAKRALLTDAGEAASGAAGGPLALRLSSYTALIEAALGGPAGRLAEALNVACCFGICAAYLVFIASTLATVAWGAAAGPAATERLVWAITPAMVGLSWLRSMAGVSLMAAAGNASVLAGMAFVAVRAARTQPWLGAGLPLAQPQGFGAYFGSVAFLFFIHFTLPAIEAAMARPGRFLGATRRAFAACGLVGAAFGALGAAAFGPGVASNVIAQLGSGAAATAVKLLLVANLFATFPIVCRSAFLVLEAAAQRAAGGMALSPLPQRALRAGFVVAASLAATLVPSFGGLIGLVGGVSLSLISLVLPALVVLLARNRAGGPLLRAGPLERAFAALVAAAGLAVVAFTLASPAA